MNSDHYSPADLQSQVAPFFFVEMTGLVRGVYSYTPHQVPDGNGVWLDVSAINDEERQRQAELHWNSATWQAGTRGLRIAASQLGTWPALHEWLSDAELLVRVADWEGAPELGLASLSAAAARVFLEIQRAEQLFDPVPASRTFAGWCAMGRESGGTPEAASQYVLLQALARQEKPFLAAGMRSPETVAACRIAGAMGVLLKLEHLVPDEVSGNVDADRTLARALYRIRVESDEITRRASQGMLNGNSALAQSHRTEFPIVQGPMTRVSDHPAFVQAVAEAGALPMLALALHTPEQCDAMLADTRSRLGERSWGVGLLGFAPPELFKEQLAAVARVRPPFCVLSGGRPDQVKYLDSLGTATWLHVPTPSLVKPYFARGVRRFVFEGSECGGHTGPHGSFTLWSEAVEALLTLSRDELRETSVLFAGGIHDGLSAAIASAFGARLVARGAQVGVLMGTAYLFTEEIVRSGAITAAFQQEAISCRSTARLVTGTGHIIRCADTPFVQEFNGQRAAWEAEGLGGRELSRKLESLTLGRARAASRGEWRRIEGGPLESLSEGEQRTVSMYMMGEVAAFRDAPLSMAALHRDVTEGAAAFAREALQTDEAAEGVAADPIAVIGMSALVPGACDPQSFWEAVLHGASPIKEIPPDRFDWRLLFDPDIHARDRMYSRWGSTLR